MEPIGFAHTEDIPASISTPKIEAFDRELNPVGWLDRFDSLQWIERPNRAGWFELWCPLDPENVEMLRVDNILWRGEENAMFVESIQPQLTAQHGLQMQVRGRTLEGYADFRIVWGMFIQRGTVSNVLRELARQNMIQPTNANRRIPMLELASIQPSLGATIDYQQTGFSLHDAIMDTVDAHDLGWEIQVDPFTKRLIFVVKASIDRTYGNTQGNDPIVFDSSTEDILESIYFYNKKDHRNVALVAGAGEGAERRHVTIHDAIGLDRRELYVDARDLSDTDENQVPIPQITYDAMLTQRGLQKLAEWPIVESYQALLKVDQFAQHQYGVDYRKGDWVTIWDRALDVQINAKVMEAMWTYGGQRTGLSLTFGFTQPTLRDMIDALR